MCDYLILFFVYWRTRSENVFLCLDCFSSKKSTHEIQIPEDAFVVLQVCAPGGRTEAHAAAQVITYIEEVRGGDRPH